MNKWLYIVYIFLFCAPTLSRAQEDDFQILIAKDSIIESNIDPLRPAKAAFYSAIVPGLGQAYNKKYWKIPLVYGAMGTSMYFYLDNNKNYHKFRDAYKQRLAGIYTDEYGFLDNARLIKVQRTYERNRDLSLLITVGFYILNIVEANVDAHLMQFNVSEKLTLNPQLIQDERTAKPSFGLTLNYKL